MQLDGKTLARKIQEQLKEKITHFRRAPCLAVVLVGQNAASKIYVRKKTQKCNEVGIESVQIDLDESISEEQLLKKIEELNNDKKIDGILLQLPLPDHIPQDRIIASIHPQKDVDGFHPLNVGKMLIGHEDGFFPCTPLGIIHLLEEYKIPMRGANVVILGRSNIVGKPMAALLMQRKYNASVTLLHSKSQNIVEHCKEADILIVAVGVPEFIKKEMVKKGAVVIDVGINRIGKKIVGDANFEDLKEHCLAISPVPGGVGPMTVITLLQNTVLSYEKKQA